MMDASGRASRFWWAAILVVGVGCGSSEPITPDDGPDAGEQRPDAGVLPPGPCEADFHVSGGSCEACPAGTVNEAGDDPAEGDTTCEALHCGVDAHVVSNACTACVEGGTRAAGDDASGPDTACDPADTCSAVFGVSCDRFDEAYLKASNTSASALFGRAIALSGDTLVVGAPQEGGGFHSGEAEDDGTAPRSGAVFVFVRNEGTWTQQAHLKASNVQSGDQFGFSVALEGDLLVVGAPYEDSAARGVNGDQGGNAAPDSGAVYVFRRHEGTWTHQAYLKASNTGMADTFGHAVALHGETLAVGAPKEDARVGGSQDDNNAPNSGAAYVFTLDGETWTQQAFLKASTPGQDDAFGVSVALDGESLAVGANGEDSSATGVNPQSEDDDAPKSGAVYVFTRSGEAWAQQARIKASNTDAGDDFGRNLALSGDTLAVGAYAEDGSATGANGDALDNGATNSGAVYVFVREGETWSQQAYLKASNTGGYDHFGASVMLEGDTLAVGADLEDGSLTGLDGEGADNTRHDTGAVYVFRRSGEAWTQHAYLKAASPGDSDRFGEFGAMNGGVLVVGAPGEDGSARGVDGDPDDRQTPDSGAVFVFRIAP